MVERISRAEFEVARAVGAQSPEEGRGGAQREGGGLVMVLKMERKKAYGNLFFYLRGTEGGSAVDHKWSKTVFPPS